MSAHVAQACSFLFVPATRPERLPKALASGADMVIVDWEDAVAPDDKAGARDLLAEALDKLDKLDEAGRTRVLVRLNAEGTPWFEDDLAALEDLMAKGCAGVVIPKAENADTVRAVAQVAGGQAALLPLIESVAGLTAADELAAASGVTRLVFGQLDFQVDAGMSCDVDELELLSIRMDIILASRRAGLPAPVDGVTVDTRNMQQLTDDARRALRMGFGGKLCIHPAQVAPLHAVFDPDEVAVRDAQRVQQALEQAGGGVCVVDGRMVDAPVLRKAEQILRRHARAQKRLKSIGPA